MNLLTCEDSSNNTKTNRVEEKCQASGVTCQASGAEYSTKFRDDAKHVDFGYFSLFFGTNYVVEGPDDWFS